MNAENTADTEEAAPKSEQSANAAPRARRPQPAGPGRPDAKQTEAANAIVAQGRKAFAAGNTTAAELRAREALEQAPQHLGALLLMLDCRKSGNQRGPDYEKLLRRVVLTDPNLADLTIELAYLLFARGERVECEGFARRALRRAPLHPRAHGMLGLILTETNRATAGEFHFRKVIEIEGESARVAANLANCLKSQGKVEESEIWYRKAIELEPANLEALLGLCRLEEARRNIPRAWELLEQAEKAATGSQEFGLIRAILLGREKKTAEAIEALTKSQKEGTRLTAIAQLERGRLYDKMDRFEEAWADYTEGKRLCREVQGRRYDEDYAKDLVGRLKHFFTRERMGLMPRASRDGNSPQPIFIVGYPRSGTTMVEQTLTAHPLVSAGDELVFINDLARIGSRWLGSPNPYPLCLADLWMGDNQLVLDQFRGYYLKRSEHLGIWGQGATHFTDKMPLNETHLGLIHLVFPHAPIIHVRRHPLDILISNYANFLTHGFNQAFAIDTFSRHFALIDDLVENYKRELDLNYLEVRYEELVADQEPHVRRMLDFVGIEFDPRCLSFHENQRYARTASYAQVTEKLYDSSVYRYRKYRKHLDEAVEILKPSLERLGYAAD
jgi:tetratricopeptide (TPR) repeat protein